MAAPEPSFLTLTIDGREVRAPEGAMLADGAKYGDIEIPVFCYEPKLGPPVGACRMCLVEIEGIPKLQTACSTPVQDGMVVSTQSERVQESQRAVVEFLLVNHPLDCPVCDKGGECPLQDITMGWGPGKNRFIDEKRHFKKPVQLSPLIAIDRERCILCYRCARFSQEVSEDYQLTLLERGAHSFIGTFDGHPYIAPFTGNITELCPVGALTSQSYRFKARPWEIEDSGSVCTLCPSQCNVSFTVRDERVVRVLARDNVEVDDGWLCDKGRYGFGLIESELRVTEPLVRDGDRLRAVSWERALGRLADGLRAAGESAAAIVGGETTNEEGWLAQRIMRRALGSPHIDSRAGGGLDPAAGRLLNRPELAAEVTDIDGAGAILVVDANPMDDAPIFDLRVRKAVRRGHARLIAATSRPGALDATATGTVGFAPGQAEATLRALAVATGKAGDGAGLGALCAAAGAGEQQVRDAAAVLAAAGDVVILWGERIGHGEHGAAGLRALANLALALGLHEREQSGLIEVPAAANARGLRDAGCLPNLGPGLAEVAAAGHDAAGIREAAAAGEVTALLLLHSDPVASHPDRAGWDEALSQARFVGAVTSFLSAGVAAHADVVLPAEAYAEKDGTLTHPDGRLQRQRPAVGRPGAVRMGWQVLADLALELGEATGVLTGPMATAALVEEVPYYAGLTLDEIGGAGVRWQRRAAAAAAPAAALEPFDLGAAPPAAPAPERGLLLGTYRPIWSGAPIEHSPPLAFLAQSQRLELAPADAEALGVADGDEVEVGSNGRRLRAEVAVREAMRPGAGWLLEGTAADPANLLAGGAPRAVEVRKAERVALPVAGKK